MATLSSSDTEAEAGTASLISRVRRFYLSIVNGLERATSAWLPGLAARFVFAAVLFGYYWNAAQTKLDGGLFTLSFGAYAQIVPPVVEAAGYDPSQIAFPWTLLVYAGTYAEFVLPVLVVIGLFGRLAALGMVGFIFVQSYVDLAFHGVTAEIAGTWCDRFPDAIIYDQRLLWLFPLIYLVLKGPGLISVDAVLGRMFAKS
ncbi:MAG: DoxX family protein [Cohaesibacteraceae bacterium]